MNFVAQTRELNHLANPMFGLLLVINAFIFPSFRASAALVDPVQPAATTALQVENAVDAMEAGVTASQSLLEQPVPYRNWGRDQKLIYESLFDSAYDLENAVYVFDNEVTESAEYGVVEGHTVLDMDFSVRFSAIVEYSYWDDDSLPTSEVNALAAVGASILGFVGTISTAIDSFSISGLVLQATRADGGRNRVLIITGIADPEVVSILDSLGNWPEDVPSGPAVDCDEAFLNASIAHRAALDAAKGAMNTCLEAGLADALGNLVGCALAGAMAGIIASAFGPGGVTVGILTGLACGVGAIVALGVAAWNCGSAFKAAANAALAAYDAAIAAARATFGEENCPADPA